VVELGFLGCFVFDVSFGILRYLHDILSLSAFVLLVFAMLELL